jgi:hypothetical protein
MIRASDLIALLKTFAHLHNVAGVPVHPIHAGTLATLLGICERDVLTLERPAASTPTSPTEAKENVIHLKFNRPTPPEGGAA